MLNYFTMVTCYLIFVFNLIYDKRFLKTAEYLCMIGVFYSIGLHVNAKESRLCERAQTPQRFRCSQPRNAVSAQPWVGNRLGTYLAPLSVRISMESKTSIIRKYEVVLKIPSHSSHAESMLYETLKATDKLIPVLIVELFKLNN